MKIKKSTVLITATLILLGWYHTQSYTRDYYSTPQTGQFGGYTYTGGYELPAWWYNNYPWRYKEKRWPYVGYSFGPRYYGSYPYTHRPR